MRTIDLQNWNRQAHFHYFSQFNSPFFNICADVDVTRFLPYIRTNNISCFKASYFFVLKTINAIDNFRYRIRDGAVIEHEVINGSCPILNDDETFNYCYFEYHPDFKSFAENAEKVLEANRTHPTFKPRLDLDNIIHSSIIPWVSFNHFEHAKRIDSGDSIPKIVIGKYFEDHGKMKMPLSVSAHHALVDGIHVGLFFKKYQALLDAPEQHLAS